MPRMRSLDLYLLRCLAVGHAAWGLLILLFAAWFAASCSQVIPHMTSGAMWMNLLPALLLTITSVFPLAALGLWSLILGQRIWKRKPRLFTPLLVTHGLLLAPGVLAFTIGVCSLNMGTQSAANGGGLLSPLALFPLGFGIGMVILSIVSIVVALTVVRHNEMR
ncbi:MAG: hypothetical protein QG656_763 [Candidatus Hydrogenedentes bacterium]|nr:hypothetical protein [Candidatus Hydrogenedentota bacterium]